MMEMMWISLKTAAVFASTPPCQSDYFLSVPKKVFQLSRFHWIIMDIRLFKVTL